MNAPKLQRWEIVASTGSHFDALDGLRGVAILLVVSFHTLYVNPDHGWLVRMFNWGVIQSGWMGVPIFFVLSGFLISYPFFQKRATDPQFWYQRGYARRRLAKILPPFYLSVVVFLIFYWLQFHDVAYFESAWKWATGLANFTPVPVPFNLSYWSLLVESHFYLLLPLLFWLTRGLSVERTGAVIFGVLFLVPLLARQLVWPENVHVLPDYTDPLQAEILHKLTRFPCQLDYFAWGVLFASVFVPLTKKVALENLRALGGLGYAGVGLMVVTLVYWGLWQDQYDIKAHKTQWSIEISHLLPAVAAMLMLFFVFNPAGLGARFLAMKWLRFVGIVSFEWFLFHGPVVRLFLDHAGKSHGSVLAYAWVTVVPLAVTFGLSVLVYRYFSLPILNRVRDSLKKT